MSHSMIIDVIPSGVEAVRSDYSEKAIAAALSGGESFESHLEDAQGQLGNASAEPASRRTETVEDSAAPSVDEVEAPEDSAVETGEVGDSSEENAVETEGQAAGGLGENAKTDDPENPVETEDAGQGREAGVMLNLLQEQPQVSVVQEQVHVGPVKPVVVVEAVPSVVPGETEQSPQSQGEKPHPVAAVKVTPMAPKAVEPAPVSADGVTLEGADLTDDVQGNEKLKALNSGIRLQDNQEVKEKAPKEVLAESFNSVPNENSDKSLKINGTRVEESVQSGQHAAERTSTRTTPDTPAALPAETSGTVEVSGQMGQGQSSMSGQGGRQPQGQNQAAVEMATVSHQNGLETKSGGVESLLGISKTEAAEPVNMQENIDRIVKTARTMVGRNQSVVQIRLDPPELGALRIEIRSDSNGVMMQLQATNARSQQLLQQHVNELRTALEARGIQTHQIDIQLRLDLKNDGSGGRQHEGQPHSGGETFDDGQQFQQPYESEQQQYDDGERYGWEEFSEAVESTEAVTHADALPAQVSRSGGFEAMEFGRLDITG